MRPFNHFGSARPQVAVQHSGRKPSVAQGPGNPFGDKHRPMPATGAAEGNADVALSLRRIPRQQLEQQVVKGFAISGRRDRRGQADAAERVYRLEGASEEGVDVSGLLTAARGSMDPESLRSLERWDEMVAQYSGEEFVYQVRGQEIRVPLHTETLSHTRVPRVALPGYRSWGDRLRWLAQENVPGEFNSVRPCRSASPERGRSCAS